jgi:hypothetical protein
MQNCEPRVPQTYFQNSEVGVSVFKFGISSTREANLQNLDEDIEYGLRWNSMIFP